MPPLYLTDFQEAAAQHAANLALYNMAAVPVGVPGSPAQTLRHGGHGVQAPTLFGFPYAAPVSSDQQFQTQLLQRLQSLSGYSPAAGPGSARSPTPFGYPQSPTLGYRMSQPSPFGSTGVMQQQHRSHSTPAATATPSPTAHSGGSASGAATGAAASTPQDEDSPNFIRPLSQVGTLTTTDHDGRTRVIVPVPMDDDAAPAAPRLNPPPAGSKGKQAAQPAQAASGGGTAKRQQQQLAAAMATLEAPPPGPGGGMRRLAPGGPPFITRSTSEKVPNRSELMTQVTRAAWARHTTK